MNRQTKWTLPDLLDFEYFLYKDKSENKSEADLSHRDREIYRKVNNKASSPENKETLLYQWLKHRKTGQQKKASLPGYVFKEILFFSFFLVAIASLVTGWLAAWSLLAYSGSQPVNISFYLLLFVFLQIFLLLSLLISFCCKPLFKNHYLSKGSEWLQNIIFFISHKLVKSKDEGFDLTAFLKQQKKQHGYLLFIPFFRLLQAGGIFFNLGVIGATFLKITTTDVAFGWQSTLQLSSQTISSFLKLFSLPWSWLFPEGVGFPNLEQIEGSRLILKDGIYHLATPDLVSWWPFLLLSVFFYALLPRIVLFLVSVYLEKRKLKKLKFNSAEARQLLRRMCNPHIDTKGERRGDSGGHEAVSLPDNNCPKTDKVHKTKQKHISLEKVFVAIPEELHELCDIGRLSSTLKNNHNLESEYFLVFADELSAPGLIRDIRAEAEARKEDVTMLVIVMEAWQPPIEEINHFLKELRDGIGREVLLNVVLIGKPDKNNILTRVEDQDYMVWQNRLAKLADPYLQVTRLLEQDNEQ